MFTPLFVIKVPQELASSVAILDKLEFGIGGLGYDAFDEERQFSLGNVDGKDCLREVIY